MGSSDLHWEPQPNLAAARGTEARAEAQSQEELKEERRRIRRLQIMVSMVMQVIAQDATLTVEQAAEMAAETRRAALAMFPGKELAFNLIYWPRLQRLMRERYRMH